MSGIGSNYTLTLGHVKIVYTDIDATLIKDVDVAEYVYTRLKAKRKLWIEDTADPSNEVSNYVSVCCKEGMIPAIRKRVEPEFKLRYSSNTGLSYYISK